MKNKEKHNGIIRHLTSGNAITLISLIITIIVLLILAGVALSLLTGNNNLFQKAEEATDVWDLSVANETAVINDWISKLDDDTTINWEEILEDANNNPDKYKDPNQDSENGDIGIGTDGKPVNMDLWIYSKDTSKKTINLYNSLSNPIYSSSYIGTFTEEGTIQGTVPKYIKPEGETKFYTVTTMMYTFYGCRNLTTAPEIPDSVTEMYGTFKECTSLTTASKIPDSVTHMPLTFDGCRNLAAAPEIPDSVINMYYTFGSCSSITTAPEIPQGVTNMTNTFSYCSKLTTAPEIPNGVTNMNWTFWYCGIETAPEIPSSVTSMYGTFADCINLTTAPEIPQKVANMQSTFEGCIKLTTAPTIPQGVTNMKETFWRCYSLTGTIEINAKPTIYADCFKNASTNEDTKLILTGSSTMLETLKDTKSDNSNIEIKT